MPEPSEVYRCDECGYEGEKRGHANREGRVCWAWSQMRPVGPAGDWHGFPVHTDASLPKDEVRVVTPPRELPDDEDELWSHIEAMRKESRPQSDESERT